MTRNLRVMFSTDNVSCEELAIECKTSITILDNSYDEKEIREWFCNTKSLFSWIQELNDDDRDYLLRLVLENKGELCVIFKMDCTNEICIFIDND